MPNVASILFCTIVLVVLMEHWFFMKRVNAWIDKQEQKETENNMRYEKENG